MKLAADHTLEEAIEYYAVLLNRPAWLAPDRRELQLRVWWTLINHFADYRHGMLTGDDFVQAIVGPGGLGTREVREVLPSRIVQDAVGYALARVERAKAIMALTPELTIFDESSRLKRTVDAATSQTEVDAALSMFRAATRAKMTTLVDSGYDDTIVGPVIDRIAVQTDNVVSQVPPFASA